MPGFFTKPDIRKPNGPTARARARKKRKDDAYAQKIREQVEARDGYCKYGFDVPPSKRSACAGQSEWAHWGLWQRSKTRGMRPEDRHTTTGSLMLCTKHHRMLDAHELTILEDTHLGCDGPLDYRDTRCTVKESRDDIE